MIAKVPERQTMSAIVIERDPWQPSWVGRWRCRICGVAYWPPVNRMSSAITGVPSNPLNPEMHEAGCPVVNSESRGVDDRWMDEATRQQAVAP